MLPEKRRSNLFQDMLAFFGREFGPRCLTRLVNFAFAICEPLLCKSFSQACDAGQCSPIGSRWCGGIDEDVVLLKFLDISFDLVHLFLEIFFPVFLSKSV